MWANVGKTQRGAVPSITDIFSLVEIFKMVNIHVDRGGHRLYRIKQR